MTNIQQTDERPADSIYGAEWKSDDKTDSEQIKATLGLEEERKYSMRIITSVGIVLLLVIAAAIYGYDRLKGPDIPNYVTEPVGQGDLEQIVTATGKLQAVNTVEVGSEISGLIQTVYVDYNDRVTAGQLLARLDTDRLEADVSQKRATLQASEASLEQALAGLREQQGKTERAEQLAGQALVSRQELESARASLTRAEAALASTRAQIVVNRAALDMAETTLEKASIRSPINGVVLARNIKEGQAVAASFQTPVLFTLAEDLSRMELHVDVDEADISRVTEGQEASFTVDAFPDTVFPARITKVYYAPQSLSEVVTYVAILQVDNDRMLLRPGMTASTDIVTNRVIDALLIPNSALRFTPPGESREAGQEAVVWILEKGRPVAVQVETGPSDERHTQIYSATLEAGQQVLVNIRQEE